MNRALGEVTVQILSDGLFALDGGALFGVVPRALWGRTNPPDDRNRVTLGLNIALIETQGLKILVDTGVGDKWSAREREIYKIDRSQTLLGSLKDLGLGPHDIDLVINTHLHFDHAGGNTRVDGKKIVPTFPRARYVVQLGEWEDATHPHERNRASYLEENFVPLAEHRQLDTIQGNVEIVKGVRVACVGGHTAFHQIVIVEGGGRTLVVPTDLVATTSHVALPFIMGYDLFPMGTLEVKRSLMRDASEQGWELLFYHDTRQPVGKVREEAGRYLGGPS